MTEPRLVLDKEHAEQMRSYGGWRADQRRYTVYLGDERIGTIESVRTESWNKSGRIRTTFLGRPKDWWARSVDQTVTTTARTAKSAVEALVRHREAE